MRHQRNELFYGCYSRAYNGSVLTKYQRTLYKQQQQQRVAVPPGNGRFISIGQVLSDAATMQHSS